MSAAAAQAKAKVIVDAVQVEVSDTASVNIQPTEDQIATRAYEIFEREGGVHGNHDTHWFQAIEELNAEAVTAEAMLDS
jgi:hypothetical protein